MIQLLTAILSVFNTFLQETKDLQRRVKHLEEKEMALSDKVTALEAAKDKLTQDVANVRTLVDGLKQNVTELTALVAELQANGTSPELEARIQAVADDLDSKDAQLDEIAPDTVPPPQV